MNPLSLLAAAAELPARTALVCAGGAGAGAWSFAQLAPRVRAEMARLGPGPGAVPLLAEPSLDALVTLYALLELERPALLVHPRLTAGERARVVPDPPFAVPAGSAAIVPTSGTTARPRGVILSRAALIAAAAASAHNLGWRDDDRWLLALPFAHVGGLSVLTRCLIARRTVVLAPDLAAAAHERVTLASLVPIQLTRALAEPPPAGLRAVLVGGAAASPALLAAARARGYPVLASYGLSETAAQVATQRPGRGDAGVGPPLPGVSLRIRDGAIEVAGATLFTGYLGAPPHQGWLTTGDLGWLDARGCLHVTGRASELIITGGENVAPAEVEAALAELGLAACVVGVPDPTWGELVAAAVVPQGPVDDAALARALAGRLAAHKRPRLIAEVAELPCRAGKLDRGAARALRFRPLCYPSL